MRLSSINFNRFKCDIKSTDEEENHLISLKVKLNIINIIKDAHTEYLLKVLQKLLHVK